MNTVLNSYGQLYGCPKIPQKSYKFFCRGLDIRVPKRVYWSLFLRRSFPIILFIVIGIPSQYPDRVQKLIHK